MPRLHTPLANLGAGHLGEGENGSSLPGWQGSSEVAFHDGPGLARARTGLRAHHTPRDGVQVHEGTLGGFGLSA
ncbi:hypothetical protein Srubr_36900 [Streptomyces rubradiris]|uniref:Uncharacterized protein n=1 Tax=Streptomyces rubradiris TaxID=285531 RepID=A0ABQ3RDD3_STRRR|nr:hypothetical protein Srubr_36900 [Streptomyces rubradiris]